MNRIAGCVNALYGPLTGRATFERLSAIMERYSNATGAHGTLRKSPGLTERDAILITYGDQVQAPPEPPLRTLGDFCARHLRGLVSGVHILPFYPYSSDDGFSVIDYRTVDPALGDWNDIARLGQDFRLMFDAVINHVSAKSEWFQRFLRDDPKYRDFFIVVPDGTDLSRVVRPRALPLLTRFHTSAGDRDVWTTFSGDQVDLNYRNPDVLLEIVDTLLFYVSRGAEFIRLDAIAFLWKEFGTTCLHLPQTHLVVQLWRAVLDAVAPDVLLVTETNVPHAENLSYFGDGTNEAQLVYNFALPPLILHTFQTGSAAVLARWAATLALPSNRTTFFNFLASHDGIGLNPVRGILSESEINALVEQALAHGGLVSYKNNPDGSTSPYELNINYLDALSDPRSDEPAELQVARFIAAQSIMLSLLGVPGIYFHSLFGSRGWMEGVSKTGQNRTINRAKCSVAALEQELSDVSSISSRVFRGYARLLQLRASQPAFDPHGSMRIVDASPAVFAVLRSADRGNPVLCLHNVSTRAQDLPSDLLRAVPSGSGGLIDLVSGHKFQAGAVLAPCQVLWLAPLD